MLQLETTHEMPPPKVARKPVQTKDIAVIIATRGRPEIVKELVKDIAQQSKPPDHTFVSETTDWHLRARSFPTSSFSMMTSSHPASGLSGCSRSLSRDRTLPA